MTPTMSSSQSNALVSVNGADPSAAATEVADMLVRTAGLSGDGKALCTRAAIALTEALLDGHSAVKLVEWSAAEREQLLTLHSLVSTDAASEPPTPLILQGSLLQFRRYHAAEQRIAQQLVSRMHAVNATGFSRLQIITGGPGSGKTTRVAELLLRRMTETPSLRIRMAAPTGKAAARMSESVQMRLQGARNGDAAGGAVTTPALHIPPAETLHRMLRYHPVTDQFRVNADAPLAADLVIVDEASMIDILTMDALLTALGPETELVLVGDHLQLASIEAGDVLGAIVRAASGPTRGMSDGVLTILTKNFRFGEDSAIGQLASAIRRDAIEVAMRVLEQPSSDDLQLVPVPERRKALLAHIQPQLLSCLSAESPEQLLEALDDVRILCAEREGILSVAEMNALVESWLREEGVPTAEPWYHRRPVLITRNDYALQLFNGDIGVCWRGAEGTRVHFPAGDGTTRAVSPEQLPASETAWAMTVHKSQGSEFGHVLFIMPRAESRVLGRSLFYTAVTRAKHRVVIVGDPGVVRQALERTESRTTGLAILLKGVAAE
jgi:exodeoxyribonuclease V alpha subunit